MSVQNRRVVSPINSGRLDWLIALAMFVVALLPRCLTLDAFLTVDEPAWIIRSAHFAQSLMRGDWAGTLQTNHPGVTTVWTGALGLAAYYFMLDPGARGDGFADFLAVAGDAYLPVDLLPAVRFPTALLAAGCIALAYLLLRKVFDRYVSTLAAGLIALDPFFITYARVIHHDALATMFVMVSWLALVVYLIAGQKSAYAALSGCAAGLAWLSKASSLLLGPLALVAFALAYLAHRRQRVPDGTGGLSVTMAQHERHAERSEASMPLSPDEKPCVDQDSRAEKLTERPEPPKRWFRRAPLRGFLWWAVAAALTFFVLWPAMWVTPWAVISSLFGESADLAGAGHLQFFLGKVVTDAGPWFYPVIFIFRVTPLALIGAALSVVYLVAGLLPRLVSRLNCPRQRVVLILLWGFVLCFMLFITLSPKKQDRYLLPIFPLIDICAAIGWSGTLRWWVSLVAENSSRALRSSKVVQGRLTVASAAWVALCLAGMSTLCAWYHPYYISFYSPLAGGVRQAQRSILVGWGEGMNLVADYLNGKPDAPSLTVAAVPYRTLAPYFVGRVTNYLTSNAPALAADYIVAYVSQVQRKGPDLRLWSYLQGRQPEATFRLHGIDYAWLYPGPRCLTTDTSQLPQPQVNGNFGGQLAFLGYDSGVGPGEATLHLYWRALEDIEEDYSFSVRLVDADGHRWAQQEGEWLGGLLPTSQSLTEYVVRDERRLPLVPGMPAGDYGLEIYAYSLASGEALPLVGEAGILPRFGLRAGTIAIPKQAARAQDIEPQYLAAEELAAGVQLVGYDLTEQSSDAALTVQPGGRISPVLYWTALRPLTLDYRVRFRLQADPDAAAWEVERPIAGGTYPTTKWVPSDVVRDWQSVPIPPDLPSGSYRLSVALVPARQPLSDVPGEDATAPRWFELARIVVAGRAHRFDLPETMQHKLYVNFGGRIEALGYDLDGSHLNADRRILLTTYWRALTSISDSYKVFVHVVGPDGQIWGQRDAIPLQGEAPTTGWLPGEVIADRFEVFTLPNSPPGTYHIRMGWYDEATGQRLAVLDGQGREVGDFVTLDERFTLD